MTKYLREHSVSKAKAETLTGDERKEAIVTGVLVDVDKPEYTEQYARLVERLQGPVASPRA
jgi:hypothetical protein